MHILYVLLVTFFAGMGAGLGTGFAGMSAAAVISPMLITFLGMDPYMAVGIALSSDVLASAVSAYTYHKNKNLDVKNGLIMMASVLGFTVVGSWLASLVPLNDGIQIFAHGLQRGKKRRPLGLVRVVQQPLQKTVLHLPAPLYHGAGLFRPDEQGLAAVT